MNQMSAGDSDARRMNGGGAGGAGGGYILIVNLKAAVRRTSIWASYMDNNLAKYSQWTVFNVVFLWSFSFQNA